MVTLSFKVMALKLPKASKKVKFDLVETVNSLFHGNEEFILLDEQKVAYEKVVTLY